MKIVDVRAVQIRLAATPSTKSRVPRLTEGHGMVSPMHRYPEFTSADWSPQFGEKAVCVITAEDGTWGFGMTMHSGPVVRLIADHLGKLIVGESCMATERLWDIMQRSTAQYGNTGLASYAISAVDNALWDLKGKVLQRPVYELLGGPQKDDIFCYASATDAGYGLDNSLEWFLELGFKAVKVFLQHGPGADLEGLNKNVELVARAREQVGNNIELMVDSWMSLDTEYVVRLSELLKPYKIKWFEDFVLPDDLGSYIKVRRRLPSCTLATGEHWYGIQSFAFAAANGLIDIFQPDVQWVGGLSAAVRICHLAEAYGLSVIAHGGMNYPFGQHLSTAMPAIHWGERSEGVSPPGVPLEEMVLLPGTPVIRNGRLTPSDAPGFGLEITKEWLEERAV